MSTFAKVAIGAICASMIMLAISAMSPETKAELSASTARKVYTVPFLEWVYVYTQTTYGSENPAHSVSISHRLIEGSDRFFVSIRHSDDAPGKLWYSTTGSKIEGRIKANCERWTARGYPISMDDFEIDTKKLPAR